jgi:hypothetical protein
MKVSEGPRYRSVRITSATTTQVSGASTTAVLRGIFIEAAPTGTITFNDAVGTKMILPISFPVGYHPEINMLFSGKLEVVTSAADRVVVVWSQ